MNGEEVKKATTIGILVFVGITVIVIASIILLVVLESTENLSSSDTIDASATILQSSTSSYSLIATPESITTTTNNQTWLDFDGVDDRIILSSKSQVNLTNNLTIGFWVNPSILPSVLGNNMRIVSRDASFYIEGTTSDVWKLTIQGLDDIFYSPNNVILTKDEWQYIVFTFDNTNMHGYLNGDYQDPDTATGSITLVDAFTEIGRDDDGDKYFNGSIDDIQIFDQALLPYQVTELKRSTSRYDLIDVPVINYHKICVGEETSVLCVNETSLRKHLNYLNDSDYTSITDVDWWNYTQGKINISEHSFIFYVDDGEEETLSVFAPILAEFGYIGVSAISTNDIGSSGIYMSWSNVTDLVNIWNWSISSHSLNVTNLPGQSMNNVNLSLYNSKNAIIGNLSLIPISFVYPSNSWNSSIMDLCEEHYDICWGSGRDEREPRFINKDRGFYDGDYYRMSIGNTTIYPRDFNDMFNYTLPLFTEKLDFNLNENSGTTAYDASGNGNNGTITGATWDTDGATKTLTNNVDYRVTGSEFVILNPAYAWSLLDVAYAYSNTEEGAREIRSGGINFITSFMEKAPVLGTLVIVLLIVSVITPIILVLRRVITTYNVSI